MRRAAQLRTGGGHRPPGHRGQLPGPSIRPLPSEGLGLQLPTLTVLSPQASVPGAAPSGPSAAGSS